MQGKLFYGSGTALITPFRGNRIDFDGLERLIDWQIDAQTDALIVLGTTGEPSTISDSERSAIIECAVSRCAGRVPLYIGTGSNDTRKAIAHSVEAMRLGADGLLVVTPFYNKCSAAGLIEHFVSIADNVSIPIIVYNVPSRTGVDIPVEVYRKLSRIPNIAGVKEASSDIVKIARILSECPGFPVWSGNDDQIVPVMALGGSGVISVLSNVAPEKTKAMAGAALDGDFDTAASLQLQLLPLIKALFSEVNPIPVKAALKEIGFDCGGCRLPLTPMGEENFGKLKTVLPLR